MPNAINYINNNYTNIDLFSFRHLNDIQNALAYIPEAYIQDFLDEEINYVERSDELYNEGFTEEVFNKLSVSNDDIFLLLAKYKITPNILLILQETLSDQSKADYDFFITILADISNHRSNSINDLFLFSTKTNNNIMNIANCIYLLSKINVDSFTEELNYLILNNAINAIPYVLEVRDLGINRTHEYKNFYDSYDELINSIRSPKYTQGINTYYSLPSINYIDYIDYSSIKPDYVYQIANETFINFISDKLDYISNNKDKDLSDNAKNFLNNYLFTIDNAINKFIRDRLYYIECYINENDIHDVNLRKDEINKMIYEVNPKIQELLSISTIDNTDNIINKLKLSDIIVSTFVNNYIKDL